MPPLSGSQAAVAPPALWRAWPKLARSLTGERRPAGGPPQRGCRVGDPGVAARPATASMTAAMTDAIKTDQTRFMIAPDRRIKVSDTCQTPRALRVFVKNCCRYRH